MKLQKNKNIVFIINSLEGGGAEKVICNWLAEMEDIFVQSQCSITLVLLDNLPEINKAPNYVNKITLDSKGSLLSSYRQLDKLMSLNAYDVMISFLNRSNVICTLIGSMRNIPTIISERAYTSQHFNNSLKGVMSKLIVKLIYPRASRVLAVSEGVRLDLINNFSVSQKKCITVQNAYNIDKIVAKSQEVNEYEAPECEFIVAIGRLHEVKNFELLISAYADSSIEAKLLILGDGPLRQQLQNQIDLLGCSNNIVLKGYQENPYPFLAQALFLVSTSNAEGFPNGIAEALCLGTPIVSTNCKSGPAEILADNVHYTTETAEIVEYGVLCKPKSKNAVKLALELMQSIDITDVYRQKLRSRAKTYSFDRVREKLVWEINHVVDKS